MQLRLASTSTHLVSGTLLSGAIALEWLSTTMSWLFRHEELRALVLHNHRLFVPISELFRLLEDLLRLSRLHLLLGLPEVVGGISSEIAGINGVQLRGASIMIILLQLRCEYRVFESHIATDVAAVFARVKSFVSATYN